MNKKWLPLLNKNIKIHTKHGIYWGIFSGIMNNRLYAKSVKIGWVSLPDLDQSKVSGVIERDWAIKNIVKLEIMCESGKYEKYELINLNLDK